MKEKRSAAKNSLIAKLLAVMISIVFVTGYMQPLAAFASEEGTAVSEAPKSEQEILASMTMEEKITQMIMVSVRYYRTGDEEKKSVTVLPDEIAKYLSDHHFGGVILFANSTESTEQTVRLIDSIQKANADGGAATQLLMGIDQEGGDVTRLNECVQGPGNMALTATGSDEDITQTYSVIGTEVTALGFNVDFCPDADVNSNPANPIIGVRSFSDDPGIVSKNVKLSLDALKETGVIACPKHFPGHGDTETDSHTGLPLINKSYDEIKKLELLPFQTGVDDGVDMIMTAHIQYPQIEKETYISKKDEQIINLPATMSKTIITDILRNDMGFEGVVVTDAMNMDAIAGHFDPLDAVELAIRAGVDIILMPGDISNTAGMAALAQGIKALASRAESNEEIAANVDAAVLRILKLKKKYGLLTAYDGSSLEQRVAEAKKVVSTRANHEKEWDITKRSITMVKNDNDTLPLTREGEKTVILTAYGDEPLPMEYAVDLLRQENRLPKGSTYEVHCFKGKTEPENRQEVLDWIDGADNVVAVSEMGSASFLTGDSAGLLDELIEKIHSQGGKFIVLSVLLPYDAARFQKADAIMLTYGARSMNMDPREDSEPMKRYGPNIAAGLYLMLQDEDKPVGRLPVNLPKLNVAGNGYTSEILYARGTGLTYGKTEPQPEKKYSNEWAAGKWYDKNGNQTYAGIGAWKQNNKGWWYQDSKGWYPKNCWQKIDGKWYYFDKAGYMEQKAYRNGYYLGANGAWDGKQAAAGWKKDSGGWWYSLNGQKYLTDTWMKIDGSWYYFKKTGYAAQSEFVNGWWVDKNCVQSDTTRYTWHKDSKGWWFGKAQGWYAKNAVYKINNTIYSFDQAGYMIGE